MNHNKQYMNELDEKITISYINSNIKINYSNHDLMTYEDPENEIEFNILEELEHIHMPLYVNVMSELLKKKITLKDIIIELNKPSRVEYRINKYGIEYYDDY